MKFAFKILITILILNSCSSNTDNPDEPDCTLTPTLTTQDVSNITDTGASFIGQIVAPTCESTVTSQGFVYAKTTLPKIDDIVVEVNGESISSDVSNLERNTKYYMRTFFVNPTGDYYGNQVEFTTAIGEVEITTKQVENINYDSADSGGIITDDGGANIKSRGVCWSTNQQPTIDNEFVINGSGVGDFKSSLTNLNELTTYYVRAFASNDIATVYGNEVSFTTPITNKIFTGNIDLCSQQDVDNFGANNYNQVNGNIQIGCNDNATSNITNLDALGSLRNVKGLYFLFNDSLSNISGLSNINSLENLYINNCDAIINLDVFVNLTELKSLSLQGNDKLENINGLNKINNLDRFTISGNSSLVNINGLSNITSVLYSLSITNNTSLTDLCGLTTLLSNNGLSGSYTVNNNGYNPSQQDIKDGNCSN